MDDVVPCINYLSGIGYGYIPVLFENSVHGFPYNFNVTLYCPLPTDVLQMLLYVFNHISAALSNSRSYENTGFLSSAPPPNPLLFRTGPAMNT